jgi:hypothetical protein
MFVEIRKFTFDVVISSLYYALNRYLTMKNSAGQCMQQNLSKQGSCIRRIIQ